MVTSWSSSRPEATPTLRLHQPGATGARASARDKGAWSGAGRHTSAPPRGSRLACRSSASRPTESPLRHHMLWRHLRRHHHQLQPRCLPGRARLCRRPFPSGCAMLPPMPPHPAPTSPSTRICRVITSSRSATSSRHLLTTPTPRRRARSPTTSTSSWTTSRPRRPRTTPGSMTSTLSTTRDGLLPHLLRGLQRGGLRSHSGVLHGSARGRANRR